MTARDMAALHAECFATPRPWSEAEFVQLLAHPLTFALSEPHGFVMGRALAGEAELLTIAVSPGHQRMGIGARLLAAFFQESAKRGAESAFLEVAETNSAAQALYLGAGFRPAGRRRGYYVTPQGEKVDALVLVRSLA
jgi:[ribosomal protein S18]-alanine N-acetyltransferase